MMSLFQVDIQSEEEIQKHKAADELITGVIDNFFRQAIARGQLAPFDTEMYTKIIFGMVHSSLIPNVSVWKVESVRSFLENALSSLLNVCFWPFIA